jgi:osmotically-inducible protein OsmY
MNDALKKRLVLGLALGVLSMGPLAMTAMAADPDASETADQALVERVQAALQADPYVFNKHIRVSVENGAVILKGFVFSDWDMRSAVRVATKAADGRRVVNNLSIKAMERR